LVQLVTTTTTTAAAADYVTAWVDDTIGLHIFCLAQWQLYNKTERTANQSASPSGLGE